MQVGSWQVDIVTDGAFALDGGAMFGVVPRALWERSHPPDDRNRIAMGLRCLLLRGHGRTILVDTGVGGKFDEKGRDIFRVDHSQTDLVRSLLDLGVEPGDVTDVFLTHLHFDHAGGASVADGDLRFPLARHWVQVEQWAWGERPTEKDRASFLRENLDPLKQSGHLELLDGPESPFPDVEIVILNGHTRALQAPLILGDPPLFFPSDLVPTASHVRLPFIMAYDNEPLVTLEEKREWLGRAADEGWHVVFEHDAHRAMGRIRRGARDFEVID